MYGMLSTYGGAAGAYPPRGMSASAGYAPQGLPKQGAQLQAGPMSYAVPGTTVPSPYSPYPYAAPSPSAAPVRNGSQGVTSIDHHAELEKLSAKMKTTLTEWVEQAVTNAPMKIEQNCDGMDAFCRLALELLDSEATNAQMMNAMMSAAKASSDGTAQAQIMFDQAAVNSQLREPLAQAFAAFDLDRDNYLSRSEAAAFFSRYVDVVCYYTLQVNFLRKALVCMKVVLPELYRNALAPSLSQLPPEIVGKIVRDQELRMEVYMQALGKQLVPQLEDQWLKLCRLFKAYQEEKDAHDAKVFQLVDTNADGRLDLNEMLAALIPGTPHNRAVAAALGGHATPTGTGFGW